MRRAFIEWMTITALLMGLAIWLSIGPVDSVAGRMQRIDAGIYGFANQLNAQPIDPALVLVEIDEASLAQIGRWPWPRTVHVAMLRKLTNAGARVIGLDVLMAEPAPEDAALANAIAAAAPTVLPVTSETDRDGRTWPIYPVYAAGQRASLGHAHFNFDVDGVVRGLYLQEGGLPAFALAVHLQAGGARNNERIRAALSDTTTSHRERIFREGKWSQSGFVLLPAVRPVQARMSYAEVLSAQTPDPRLRGKTVLIGATAAGMRDAFTNAILIDETVSPGVYLHAAAFTAVASNRLQHRIDLPRHILLIVFIVLMTMLLLYRTAPRGGLITTTLSLLLTVAVSIMLLQFAVWVPPAGTLAAVLIAYPLWSWRRLEAVVAELALQANALRRAPDALVQATAGADIVSSFRPLRQPRTLGGFLPPVEPVAFELRELRESAHSITGLRLLLSTVLEGLPHAALVCAADGLPLLRNRVARNRFPAPAPQQDGWAWFSEEFGTDLQAPPLPGDGEGAVSGLERRDRNGCDWLIDSTRVQAPGLPVLWLLQFTDISEIRNLQRQREEMMRFISHDLRSPQISIISALGQIPSGQRSEWTQAIGQHANQSLQLADSFVHWTRAESKAIEEQPIDLAALVTEAVDASWLLGEQQNTPIGLSAPELAITIGDAQLIRRAIGNLIDNAIKYGGPDNSVTVCLESRPPNWEITVSDTGPGLGDIDSADVFEPYIRGSKQRDRSGTGLGLAFVRMVAERHGGAAHAANLPDGGARFTIQLPARPANAE